MSVAGIPPHRFLALCLVSIGVAAWGFVSGPGILLNVGVAGAAVGVIGFALTHQTAFREHALVALLLLGFGAAVVFSVPQLAFVAVPWGLYEAMRWALKVSTTRTAKVSGAIMVLCALAFLWLGFWANVTHTRGDDDQMNFFTIMAVLAVVPWAYSLARAAAANRARAADGRAEVAAAAGVMAPEEFGPAPTPTSPSTSPAVRLRPRRLPPLL
jgi:hypothetical protein